MVVEAYNNLIALACCIESNGNQGVTHRAGGVGVNSPEKNGVSRIGGINGYVHLSVGSIVKNVAFLVAGRVDNAKLVSKRGICPSCIDAGIIGSSCVSTVGHIKSHVVVGYAGSIVSDEYGKNGVYTLNGGLELRAVLNVSEYSTCAVVYSPEVDYVSTAVIYGSEVHANAFFGDLNNLDVGTGLSGAHGRRNVCSDTSKLSAASVTNIVIVCVCAEIFLTNVTVVVSVGIYVGTLGNLGVTLVAEVVAVAVVVHCLVAIVTYAVVVKVVAHGSAALVAVAIVVAVSTHALATLVTVVVSVAAVCTGGNGSSTNVTLVIVVVVCALSKNCLTGVTLVVVAKDVGTFAHYLAANVTLVVYRGNVGVTVSELFVTYVTVVVAVCVVAIAHYLAAKVTLVILGVVGALGKHLTAGVTLMIVVAVCMRTCRRSIICGLVNVAARCERKSETQNEGEHQNPRAQSLKVVHIGILLVFFDGAYASATYCSYILSFLYNFFKYKLTVI